MLFPYLNGEDLNSRPDSSASRWVIDFNDRSEEEAATYPLPFARILEQVKPERQKTKPDGTYVMRSPMPEKWWQYGEKRPALRSAVSALAEVLVISRVSKTVMPARVANGQVFSDKLDVFATASYSDQAVLSSSLHQLWAITYGATMRADAAYTPSTVFETFPRPAPSQTLDNMGGLLDSKRRAVMLNRRLGLTSLYNMVNDRDITSRSDSDIASIRDIHVALDQAVVEAYGWGDVGLHHGFHQHRQVTRWTLSPEVRTELLDRLLEENHRRAT